MDKKVLHLMIFWVLGCALAAASNLQIQKECSFTTYPKLCLHTLMKFNGRPVNIVSALVNKTISETKLPNTYFKSLGSQLLFQATQQYVQSTTDYCEKLMDMSLRLLDKSILALKQSPQRNKNDLQTWLSAVLTYHQACKDSVESLSSTTAGADFTSQISHKMDYLSKLVSNPLALVNRIKGDDGELRRNSNRSRVLDEEKLDFPKWVSMKNRKLLQTSTIKANAVVAKDGTGNYRTISEAIKAAPGGRFVIYVKAGVYNEKISTNKDGITLIGDGKYSTIIAGSDSVRSGSSMPDSATFTITGDGFIARDIGFQNTAGPQGEQALALFIASDRSVLYRCSIVGYQDTLYALSQRQFYRECDIYGTVDFIFGNAVAVFQNCYIVLRRPNHGSYNVILANGRSDPGQNSGFCLQNCRTTASSDFSPVKHGYSSYLGRPWKQYSRSIVMESYIDDAISSRGWIEWPGSKSYGKTLYFAEYSNTGPGAGTSSRASWPGFHVIQADEAVQFTVRNFISGTSWLPSTGVTFVSGLQ